jgi:hypothetical protein
MALLASWRPGWLAGCHFLCTRVVPFARLRCTTRVSTSFVLFAAGANQALIDALELARAIYDSDFGDDAAAANAGSVHVIKRGSVHAIDWRVA